MDAPDKIYLQQYDEDTLLCLNEWNISEEWTTKPCNEKIATNIEYICADTFREKALEYIENNIYDHYDGDHEYGVCGGYVKKEEFIDGFIKYMKSI